jgi:curli biogenesis system outer membrane secretion channel CsgG
VELEGGAVKNEPMSIALQMAIETAVKEIIEQGIEKEYWRYKQ